MEAYLKIQGFYNGDRREKLKFEWPFGLCWNDIQLNMIWGNQILSQIFCPKGEFREISLTKWA